MKGQIEFGETLMVVIVLVFLLILGIVFYFRISTASLQAEIADREDTASIVLGKRVLSLPEVQCNALKDERCIDQLKLEKLANLMTSQSQDRDYYSTLFGFATIKLYVLDSDREILIYDDAPGGTTMQRQFIFTTLYNPVTRQQELAYLNVTRYGGRI